MADGDGFLIPYLAGFFDGEGCIYARNGLQVSATQIDVRPLLMLQRRFGGRVRAPGATQKSPTSTWVIYGKPAAEALAVLTSGAVGLVVKRRAALLAIEYATLVKPRTDAHHGRQVDDATKAERERLRQLIMANRKGNVSRREDGEFRSA